MTRPTVQPTTQIFSPKPFQILFAGLGCLVLLIGATKLAGYHAPSFKPVQTAKVVRILTFDDAPSGHVIVRDRTSQKIIADFGRGQGSFVRATLRALVHDQQHKGALLTNAFRLEQHSNGQLFLIDEATTKAISLNAFGPDNTAAFAAFLPTPNPGESL
jgi:putative photosynthetic complex assembly protein